MLIINAVARVSSLLDSVIARLSAVFCANEGRGGGGEGKGDKGEEAHASRGRIYRLKPSEDTVNTTLIAIKSSVSLRAHSEEVKAKSSSSSATNKSTSVTSPTWRILDDWLKVFYI
jgi:hypothetical protein